jgi:hypothetical protein
MNATTKSRVDTLRTAFALVDPLETIGHFYGADMMRRNADEGRSWRDRIATLVPQERLDAAGVTIDDVRESVIHFTATEPTITAHTIGQVGIRHYHGRPGYLVLAEGYRRGPAGP